MTQHNTWGRDRAVLSEAYESMNENFGSQDDIHDLAKQDPREQPMTEVPEEAESDVESHKDLVTTKIRLALRAASEGNWTESKEMLQIALDHLEDAESDQFTQGG